MRGTVLVSLMREDPNVIMVGEIRDEEVAQIVGHPSATAREGTVWRFAR
jgi:type II secretory ATPase GspE/PulE/Tfp pilus assembly ATPase PilB-like protein